MSRGFSLSREQKQEVLASFDQTPFLIEDDDIINSHTRKTPAFHHEKGHVQSDQNRRL